MAIVHMSYRDLTADQRKVAADAARKRLHEHLSNPTITPEQATTLQGKLEALDRWEMGTLHGEMPDAVKGQTHVVTVSEAVKVSET